MNQTRCAVYHRYRERIKTLEKANAETVDLTADVSFETTVSVHSSDMSDKLPKCI